LKPDLYLIGHMGIAARRVSTQFLRACELVPPRLEGPGLSKAQQQGSRL